MSVQASIASIVLCGCPEADALRLRPDLTHRTLDASQQQSLDEFIQRAEQASFMESKEDLDTTQKKVDDSVPFKETQKLAKSCNVDTIVDDYFYKEYLYKSDDKKNFLGTVLREQHGVVTIEWKSLSGGYKRTTICTLIMQRDGYKFTVGDDRTTDFYKAPVPEIVSGNLHKESTIVAMSYDESQDKVYFAVPKDKHTMSSDKVACPSHPTTCGTCTGGCSTACLGNYLGVEIYLDSKRSDSRNPNPNPTAKVVGYNPESGDFFEL